MSVFPRSGALAAWGSAYLRDAASLDEAAAAAVGSDSVHRVVGLTEEPEPVPLTLALARLRNRGVQALRLVLPVPGDLTGVPGPATFAAAALAAGEAVLTVSDVGQASLALVPSVAESGGQTVVRWDVVAIEDSAHPHGLPTLSEADRLLSESMLASTNELAELDVARGRDDVAGQLRAIERAAQHPPLPPGTAAKAVRVATTSARILAVLALASRDDGAAVTANEARARLDALRPLRQAARHALCAACSTGAETASGRGPARR